MHRGSWQEGTSLHPKTLFRLTRMAQLSGHALLSLTHILTHALSIYTLSSWPAGQRVQGASVAGGWRKFEQGVHAQAEAVYRLAVLVGATLAGVSSSSCTSSSSFFASSSSSFCSSSSSSSSSSSAAEGACPPPTQPRHARPCLVTAPTFTRRTIQANILRPTPCRTHRPYDLFISAAAREPGT